MQEPPYELRARAVKKKFVIAPKFIYLIFRNQINFKRSTLKIFQTSI